MDERERSLQKIGEGPPPRRRPRVPGRNALLPGLMALFCGTAMLGLGSPPVPGSAKAREVDPDAPKSPADLERIRLAEAKRDRKAARKA